MFDLAAIITSTTRLSVIKFFLSNPQTEAGVRESARRLGLNVMLVRNELLLLQKAGLLKSRHVANSIQYSLDAQSQAVEPLKKLIEASG